MGIENTLKTVQDRINSCAVKAGRDPEKIKLVAVTKTVELQEVIDRQTTRTDKEVPIHAVERMYMQVQLPSYGDFDGILVTASNL